MAEGVPQLGYAPARRRHLKRLVICILIAIAAIVAERAIRPSLNSWIASIRHRRQLIKFQESCLNLSVPPDTLVYGEGSDVESMAKSSPPLDYPATWSTGGGPGGQRGRSWRSRSAPDFCRLPYTMQSLNASTANWGAAPTLFMHGRTTPAGQPYLVAVHLIPIRATFDDARRRKGQPMKVLCHVVAPFGQSGPLPVPLVSTVTIGSWPDIFTTHTRFYAGQFDPNDLSRFTIRYEIDDQPGIIHGKLNNGATLSLTVYDGPLLPQATTRSSALPSTRPAVR